jgi:hypothetical protein
VPMLTCGLVRSKRCFAMTRNLRLRVGGRADCNYNLYPTPYTLFSQAHYGNRTHDLFFTKEVLCL